MLMSVVDIPADAGGWSPPVTAQVVKQLSSVKPTPELSGKYGGWWW